MGGLRGRDLKKFVNKTIALEIHFGLGFRSLGWVITKLKRFYSAHFNLKHTVIPSAKFLWFVAGIVIYLMWLYNCVSDFGFEALSRIYLWFKRQHKISWIQQWQLIFTTGVKVSNTLQRPGPSQYFENWLGPIFRIPKNAIKICQIC